MNGQPKKLNVKHLLLPTNEINGRFWVDEYIFPIRNNFRAEYQSSTDLYLSSVFVSKCLVIRFKINFFVD